MPETTISTQGRRNIIVVAVGFQSTHTELTTAKLFPAFGASENDLRFVNFNLAVLFFRSVHRFREHTGHFTSVDPSIFGRLLQELFQIVFPNCFNLSSYQGIVKAPHASFPQIGILVICQLHCLRGRNTRGTDVHFTQCRYYFVYVRIESSSIVPDYRKPSG